MVNKLIKLLLAIMLFSFSTVAGDAKGTLLIIGGGSRPDYMMEKIIELAGGDNSKILVIPNASSDPIDVAEYQVNQLKSLGANNVEYVFLNGQEANSDSALSLLEGVTGIFFSGGDQSRLTEDLLGTKFLEKIKSIYREGGVISGTSAGAAVMSEIMITGNEIIQPDSNDSFTTIMSGNIETTKGFGFITSAIIDQHFIYRKRHNRLLSLVLDNPKLLGIGIDESTAILVHQDFTFDVIGEFQVIIYDASDSADIAMTEKGFFGSSNIKMHILKSGDKFSLISKNKIK